MAAKMVENILNINHTSAIYEPIWFKFEQYVKNKFIMNKINKNAKWPPKWRSRRWLKSRRGGYKQ